MLCVNVILLLYYIIFINYETAVAFVVILFVFSVMFSNIRFDTRTWLKKGCAFFGLILVSAFVWKVVEKIIFKSCVLFQINMHQRIFSIQEDI